MDKIKAILFKKRKLTLKSLVFLIVIFIVSASLIVYDNFQLDTEYIKIESEKLSDEFDGYRIAHISDYHNRKNELFDKKIIDSLNESQPDIIVITGDLIDTSKPDVDVAVSFTEKLLCVAPVYYIMGNHESNIYFRDKSLFEDMLDELEKLGVVILKNDYTRVFVSDKSSYNLYGLDEPYFHCGAGAVAGATDKLCKEFTLNDSEFNVLLAHHPEQLPIYSKYGFDLVLSGHAHAGQFRVFNQGVYAPDQGFLPKYTGGLYELGKTRLVLSRGLGNSVFPFRVFNQAHMIVVEIKVI